VEAERNHCQQNKPFQWLPLLLTHVLQSSTTTDVLCTSPRPAEERGGLYAVYIHSPTMNSTRLDSSASESPADGCPAACWYWSVERRGRQHTVPIYSDKLYFLYMDMMEALTVRSILLNNHSFFFLSFFKIMSKCIKSVDGTPSRASACGRDRTLTEELARSCLVVLCFQEGILFSGHHNASNVS